MHDIRAIRLAPDAFDLAWARRGLGPAAAGLLVVDEALRAAQTALQQAQSRRNEVSTRIGRAKAAGDSAGADAALAEVETLKQTITEQARRETELTGRLRESLAGLPNLPAPEIPTGEDETGNVEVRRWGETYADGLSTDHVDLGAGLGMMDFEAASRMSGARFVVLRAGPGASRTCARPVHARRPDPGTWLCRDFPAPAGARSGAVWHWPASQIRRRPFSHDGRLLADPHRGGFAQQHGRGADNPGGRVTDAPNGPDTLFPIGSGRVGADTRGMIRQHQFPKVELVSITTPEAAQAEHERMVECAESILKRLELPFRTMLLCSGDTGFSARKTYDLEVWLPSQNTYREISSCSDCGDFQARRMDARFKRLGEKGARFVHTLNGSGLAVGRALVAVMENYQDEKGRIAVPQALHPYMRGLTRIGPDGV